MDLVEFLKNSLKAGQDPANILHGNQSVPDVLGNYLLPGFSSEDASFNLSAFMQKNPNFNWETAKPLGPGETGPYGQTDDTPPTYPVPGQGAPDGADGEGESDVALSDFSSRAGLPEWASQFIKEKAAKYTNQVWENYQKSLYDLNKVPGYIEEGRKASQSQYLTDVAKFSRDASRRAAFTTAARGTAESSVGTDYIQKLAQDVVAATQKQQAANVGAAGDVLQNQADVVAATQGFSGLIARYIGATNSSYDPNFGDLTLEADPSWEYASKPIPLGTHLPDNKIPASFQEQPLKKEWADYYDDDVVRQYLTPGGETVLIDTTSGAVLRKEGTFTAPGADPNIPEINASDFARKSQLEPWAEEAIKGVVDKYGERAIGDSVKATERYGDMGAIDTQARTLNSQYGGLSDQTMALLRSALGTAGMTGGSYGAQRDRAIADTAAGGIAANQNATTQWGAGQKVKRTQNYGNLSADLARQIGEYLGLARYSFSPNFDKYLQFGQ